MNKQQAEFLAGQINDILGRRTLVTVHVVGNNEPDIRVNQQLKEAICSPYTHNDKWFLTISDSYGVMGNGDFWRFDPDKRTLRNGTTNSLGEIIYSSWTVSDADEEGIILKQMNEARKAYRQIES